MDLFKSVEDERSEAIEDLLLSLCPQFKHKSFEDEREWRAIAQKPSDGSNVDFRTKDNVLVPFLRLGVRDKKLPIVSVTIGPGKDMDLTRRSVDNYLASTPFYKGL
jgi:hypothetical protein